MQQTKPRLWTKEFLLITACNFLMCFVFQMLIPTLPVFALQMGASSLEIGLIVAVFTISAVFARPFAGRAIDGLDRKKVLFFSLLLFFLCVCGYGWSTSIPMLLVLRFLHGIAWGFTTTTYGVLASDVIPPARMGEGLGYFTLSNNLALALGPVVGLWLITAFSFNVMFIVGTVITVALIALTMFFIPASKPVGSAEPVPTQSFWSAIVERNALFPSLLVFFVGINYGGIISFLTMFGKERGIENISLFFLINALFIVMIRPLSGRLFDRKGHITVLLPGAIFWGIGLLLLSYTDSTPLLFAAALFFGIGYGAVQPSLQAWAVRRAGVQRRGMATGTFLSFFDLGIGLGSVFLGMVAQASSYALMYRISAIVPLIYLAVYLRFMLKERSTARESKQVSIQKTEVL